MAEGSDPTIDMGTPASTVALPAVADPSPRPTILALTFLAVAAGAFLIGIAVASTNRGTAASGVLVASRQVGPAGATVRFDGGEIRIPAGALASSTRIVVRRTVVSERVRVRPPGGLVRIFDPRELVAYVFEPRNVDFLRPVTLMFRLTDRTGGAAAFARVGEATLLLGGDVDTDRGTVSIEVSDFRFTRGQPIGADQ